MVRIDDLRPAASEYFRRISLDEPESHREGVYNWRMFCYDTGARYVQWVEENVFPVRGKQILDVACAWGGHAMSFAAAGGEIYAGDILDHRFSDLKEFVERKDLPFWTFVSDCQQLPFGDESFDILLGFELVEHIPSPERFATEVARLLRPGGICLISTPPKWRSLIQGEPHYKLRGLTLLPFGWQRPIATKLFGRKYPFPITRQYSRADDVIKPFRDHGLQGRPMLVGKPAEMLHDRPGLLEVGQRYFWNFILISKPAG